jgi:hypothetical protein
MPPPGPCECSHGAYIDLLISLDFLSPEVLSCLGPLEEVTVVPMPKTTVDKDYSVVLGEYKVRLAGKSSVMKHITEALGM